MSGESEQFGGEALNNRTRWMTFVVFVMNLLFIFKGSRQLQSASDWYKPSSIFDHIADRAIQVEDTVKHGLKQIWLNPVRAFWYSLLYVLGERMDDYGIVCDVMTYWMVNATLLLLIWRTSFTVEFAVITTFLILIKLLGYLRGFENCGWLLSVLRQVRRTAVMILWITCSLAVLLIVSSLVRRWCLTQMFLDSKGFLIVIFTIFLGFSVMFQILIGPYNENYSTAAQSFISIFEIGILGFIDRTDFAKSQSIVLTMILLVVLVLVVFIIALVRLDLFLF